MSDQRPTQDEVVKMAFRYQNALVSYAFAILRDWELAKDVVQDAYLVVLKKHADFIPGTSIYAWVRTIVHHKAMQALRGRLAEIPVEEAALEELVRQVVEAQMDEKGAERLIRMRQALEDCMSGLKTDALRLLVGFYAECKPCEMLASLHRRSVEAVRMALSRLRDRLRKCMIARLSLREAEL